MNIYKVTVEDFDEYGYSKGVTESQPFRTKKEAQDHLKEIAASILADNNGYREEDEDESDVIQIWDSPSEDEHTSYDGRVELCIKEEYLTEIMYITPDSVSDAEAALNDPEADLALLTPAQAKTVYEARAGERMSLERFIEEFNRGLVSDEGYIALI